MNDLFLSLKLPCLETLYLTLIPLFFSVIFGFFIGTLIFISSSESGVFDNNDFILLKFIHFLADSFVNIFRAIPYIILLIWLIPLAKLLTGHMLGTSAAIPSLVISATPFFARMVVIAFNEVNKGTIEASRAMGASLWTIIWKVLIRESSPALISGICVTGINLVSYSAMAGAIGSGGLGFAAYNSGLVRKNNLIFYGSVALILLLVFTLQWLGDKITKNIDKR